ncbi:metal ABC transporter solute-binding protein, Zn/Mn family [Tissierella creatinophila]|uniref:Periplasmic zinc-binding protein TroA n=1 Tax=Tissierella creatinophila DSM 6911 TaxID=1123403 RepID=A0A1U7M7G8_TISCR|nr:zinc ABC transporter substrate-binding protein [Tissierella creatinophila]OLS03159.1 periplasmic zinc-binding protein TroA precursor [Tissierella creatinophila DSM 6911]
MKRIWSSILVLSLIVVVLAGCTRDGGEIDSKDNGKLKVVTTTTIIADVVRNLAGDLVEVEALMGPGVDPHLYKASAGDVKRMSQADMVIYNGLQLEGKMGEVFENIKGKVIFAANEDLDESKLLDFDTNPGYFDPHVWFDVQIWKSATQRIAEGLKTLDSENGVKYDENLEKYLTQLDELDKYVRDRTGEIDPDKRILVTAHDAFQYFGNQYGFEVSGLQGISTDAEAGTSDVRQLANFIVDKKIKVIFIESSVPRKNIEALKEAVKAKGFDVKIGGELYSDSTGDAGTPAESYIGTVKANIDTIVNALK